MEKRSHLGMAGHYAAMAEFLYRGYNVAVPAVDIGDDVYIVEDQRGTMWRLQVKTSADPRGRNRDQSQLTCTYALSRRQLGLAKPNELYFMFMMRWDVRWRFVLVHRRALRELREQLETRDRSRTRGRKPVVDEHAKSDGLILRLDWSEHDVVGWGASLKAYLDCWPDTFPNNPSGPGAVRAAVRLPDP